MKRYILKRPTVRGFAPITARLSQSPTYGTKPITKQRKKRFGIFKKKEEW